MLLQPSHWKAEVASVLVRRAPAAAVADLDDLNLLEGIEVVDTPVIYHRALQMAIDLSHHLFDTLYQAAAIESDALMVTADQRYFDQAKQLGRILLLDGTAT